MLKFRWVSLVGAVLISFSAQAVGTFAAELSASNNPFATLKNGFETSRRAQITDYPKIDELYTPASNLKCVSVCRGNCSYPEIMQTAAVGQLVKVIPGTPAIPGTPGNGPLFPGTPDTPATPDTVVTLLTPVLSMPMGYAPSPVTNSEVVDFLSGYDQETTTTPQGELYSTLKSPLDQRVHVTTTYRKKVDLLFFHEVSGVRRVEIYGYCYPE